MILVTIIIVTYNTRDLTSKSIRHALLSKGFKNDEVEIIVVDNHSVDDTAAYIKSNFPEVRLIVNKDNKGFGAGNNQAAKIAKGKYLLLLNTDAFLERNTLRVLVDILEKNEDVGSVGPQLRNADGSLQQSAGYLPTPSRIMAWMWWLDKLPGIKKLFSTPYHIFDLNWYRKSHYPGWLMAACVLFRKTEFLAANGFDDKIFMYAEEVELYRRMDEAIHKKNYFTTKTFVTHLVGASSKRANAFRLVYELRGVEYIYKKHYPNMLWFMKPVLLSGAILRIIIYSLMPSRADALAEYKKYFAPIK